MKICTSLEQSQKLIELGIDVNTADMYWWYLGKNLGKRYYVGTMDDDDFNEKIDVPCWSLVALLGVMPSSTLDSSDDHHYRVHCRERFSEWHDNAVDACVEMILKLREQMIDDFNKDE